MSPRLSGLFVYPVKSAGGIALSQAELTTRGLRNDRRFMIADGAGRFVTQREAPQLARLGTALVGEELRLTFDALPALSVPLAPRAGSACQVTVWRDTLDVLDCGDDAAGFCTALLGQPARLVFMPDHARRTVKPSHAPNGDLVSFADGFPYLLTNEGSLGDLNGRLDTPVGMERFRPNLVVSGAAAYAEDGWRTVRIGALVFDVRKPCDRCVIITTDQQTGQRSGKEPLKTLARYHTWEGKAAFGQNLLSRQLGHLRVGDAVEVLG